MIILSLPLQCPKCKKGHLRPTGDAGVQGENKSPFRETGSMRELICDNCGHRQINEGLREYVPVSDILSANVTKANPEKKKKVNFLTRIKKYLSR